jgi:ubiquinone/menaquinone biosynthesis C-methylase UbiE
MKKKTETSWGSAAQWYSNYLEDTDNTYQRQVILPNLLRILDIKKDTNLIDIACGQGFFAREFAQAGAQVMGTDISKELIAEAKKLSPKDISYQISPAHKIAAKDDSFDAATIVLAIQNIENMGEVFAEAARVLKKGGALVMVMMHPSFRIPEHTSWSWDEQSKTQYRRVDRYLSASKAKLLVHPGKKNSATTMSYHRSLQDFSKALFKAGFSITRLEEWISHKESGKGPRQAAENLSRKEIPLFLMLEARTL